jgi:hypothetical protein
MLGFPASEHLSDVSGRKSHKFSPATAGGAEVIDMTTDFEGRPAETPTIDDGPTAPTCEACGHDLSVHDATSTRFCKASLGRATARGCMCTSADGVRLVPVDPSDTPMYGRGRFSKS